jgi:hypothetical protein
MTLRKEFLDLIQHVGWYADEKYDWVQDDEDLKLLDEAGLRRFNHNKDLLLETMHILAESFSPKGVTPEMVVRLKEIVNEQLTHPDFKD